MPTMISLKERLLILLAAVVLFTVAIAVSAIADDKSPSAGPSSQPTVYIQTSGAHFCSGVYLGDGIVLTAAHCVLDWTGSGIEKGLMVGYEFGEPVPAYVALLDDRYDFALLIATPPSPVRAAVLDCRDPVVGEDVSIVGFPGDLDWVTTFGRVSSLYQGDNNWPVFFVADAASIGGNSGGPVFDADGEILGILVGGPGQELDAFSYVVPSTIICPSVNLSIS